MGVRSFDGCEGDGHEGYEMDVKRWAMDMRMGRKWAWYGYNGHVMVWHRKRKSWESMRMCSMGLKGVGKHVWVWKILVISAVGGKHGEQPICNHDHKGPTSAQLCHFQHWARFFLSPDIAKDVTVGTCLSKNTTRTELMTLFSLSPGNKNERT